RAALGPPATTRRSGFSATAPRQASCKRWGAARRMESSCELACSNNSAWVLVARASAAEPGETLITTAIFIRILIECEAFPAPRSLLDCSLLTTIDDRPSSRLLFVDRQSRDNVPGLRRVPDSDGQVLVTLLPLARVRLRKAEWPLPRVQQPAERATDPRKRASRYSCR